MYQYPLRFDLHRARWKYNLCFGWTFGLCEHTCRIVNNFKMVWDHCNSQPYSLPASRHHTGPIMPLVVLSFYDCCLSRQPHLQTTASIQQVKGLQDPISLCFLCFLSSHTSHGTQNESCKVHSLPRQCVSLYQANNINNASLINRDASALWGHSLHWRSWPWERR